MSLYNPLDSYTTAEMVDSINDINIQQEAPIFDKFFKPKMKFAGTDVFRYDIMTGSKMILKSLSPYADIVASPKPGVNQLIQKAIRLADARNINAAELLNARQFGDAIAVQTLKELIGWNQADMLNRLTLTWEFWAWGALRGKIYDADMTTLLVDYDLLSTHDDPAASNYPIEDLRKWKRLIKADAVVPIPEGNWTMYCGKDVMDDLMKNTTVKQWLTSTVAGNQVASDGTITKLAGINIQEWGETYTDLDGVTQTFLDDDEIILIGETADMTRCYYAPIMNFKAPNGVGNIGTNGKPAPIYSDLRYTEDGKNVIMSVDTMSVPCLTRPACVFWAKPTEWGTSPS